MRNSLGAFAPSNVQNWTEEAVKCYESKFDCLNCNNYYLLISQPCQMKAAVIELFKKYGKPKKEFIMEKPYFTKRELDVLELLAAGFDNGKIMSALFISRPTLSKHIANIYFKLGITGKNRRVRAALWYVKNHGESL